MEEIMNYQARKEEIRKKLKETAEDFVYIGYQLKQVKANREYEQDGYKDVLEFARKEYGLHKDDTYRFIRINDKYSRGGNSMELDERFRGIAQTKLSEMLSLPDKDLELVTPETNREDIRELKRFNSQKPEEAPEEKGNDLQNIILEFFRPAAGRPAVSARQVLFDLLAVVEGKSKDPVLTQEEQIQELLNPKGNGVFRAGWYMVFMYDASQGMKYKIFGKSENHSVSYLAFAKTAHLIFTSGSKNPELDPWENQYGREEEEERASQPEPVSLSMSDSKANEVQAGLKAPVLPRYVDNSENHETEEKKVIHKKMQKTAKKRRRNWQEKKAQSPRYLLGFPRQKEKRSLWRKRTIGRRQTGKKKQNPHRKNR